MRGYNAKNELLKIYFAWVISDVNGHIWLKIVVIKHFWSLIPCKNLFLILSLKGLLFLFFFKLSDKNRLKLILFLSFYDDIVLLAVTVTVTINQLLLSIIVI